MQKINDLQAAYNLAAWILDKSLAKLSILIQNETVVEASAYAECAAHVHPVREVLDQVEAWLAEHGTNVAEQT